jgi:NTP pyrophosphatase (non-canonical NTP hydrolase)
MVYTTDLKSVPLKRLWVRIPPRPPAYMKLPDKPALSDYHQLIRELIVERGFHTETVPEVFMLFLEEAGEFAKAARKVSGITTDKNSKVHNVEEEAADVFWLLIDLCNRLDIDLEQAFRNKEAKNQQRQWT